MTPQNTVTATSVTDMTPQNTVTATSVTDMTPQNTVTATSVTDMTPQNTVTKTSVSARTGKTSTHNYISITFHIKFITSSIISLQGCYTVSSRK
jgi:hypothetical protein